MSNYSRNIKGTSPNTNPNPSMSVPALMARLEENHRIQQHYRQFEYQLLSCTRLEEALTQILDVALVHFDLSDVCLVVEDPKGEMQALASELDLGDFNGRLLLSQTTGTINHYYDDKFEVSLRQVDGATGQLFFPGKTISSMALLPLKRNERVIGSWHFGSKRSGRFTEDKGTDFLTHLSLVVAVCLENTLRSEHLRRQSMVDTLTGVKNRRSFDADFICELERANRSKQPLVCLFIDIDHFKQVNDNYGHQVGDLCLQAVAAATQQELRSGDILARFGGEEFVLLLPSSEAAMASAERIRKRIAELSISLTCGNVIRPTASLGVAVWRPQGKALSDCSRLAVELLKTADLAMYDAKENGRNCVCVRDFSFS